MNMDRISRVALVVCFASSLAMASVVSAQAPVTASDVQRLQDSVFQASNDIAQLRTRDSSRAGQLQTELDDLRDEVTYLKVKLRKERTLARTEYADVRDRIEDLRTRARGDATGSYAVAPSTPAPAGLGDSRDTGRRRQYHELHFDGQRAKRQ
jgi:TolA-binding protein